MAAMTNLLGNGITRLLGIRNLTWEDLEKYAGIKKDQVGKIEYNGKNKEPLKEPQKKKADTKAEPSKTENQVVITTILDVESKQGITQKKDSQGKEYDQEYKIYGITDENKVVYKTFSESFADIANTAKGSGDKVKIVYQPGKFGNNIVGIAIEEREPGIDG
jgi:hypothetical protein